MKNKRNFLFGTSNFRQADAFQFVFLPLFTPALKAYWRNVDVLCIDKIISEKFFLAKIEHRSWFNESISTLEFDVYEETLNLPLIKNVMKKCYKNRMTIGIFFRPLEIDCKKTWWKNFNIRFICIKATRNCVFGECFHVRSRRGLSNNSNHSK